jgi:hypothetical protein
VQWVGERNTTSEIPILAGPESSLLVWCGDAEAPAIRREARVLAASIGIFDAGGVRPFG